MNFNLSVVNVVAGRDSVHDTRPGRRARRSCSLFSALPALLLGLAWIALPDTALGQPNYTNATEVASYVKQMVYWPDADSTNKNIAAFRYKVLLYTNETDGIRAAQTNMTAFYGAGERTRAQQAENHLRTGLTNNPASALLQNLLLDIYYDRTTAEAILANNQLADMEHTRLHPTSPPGGFVIDNEITICSNALAATRGALQTYLVLLTNNLGVASSPPLGWQIFQQLVPTRALEPASYVTAIGDLQSVTGSTNVLFSEYKDLVLLNGLLRDYGRDAVTLARLYYGRNKAGDLDRVKTSVTDSQRFLYLQSALLRGCFPNLDPAAAALQDSGLAESIAGVNDSLTALNKVQVNIQNAVNPLDFQPDFLMLVQRFAGTSGDIFDSFDAFQGYLNPTGLSSPLRYAQDLLTQARTAYDNYRGYQDQLQDQLRDTSYSARDRLYQIVGTYPEDPAYEHPEDIEGGEIWQQLKSIDSALLAIRKNSVQVTNLLEQVQIEIDRTASVTNAVVKWGDKQAELTIWIASIAAAQAFADKIANAFSVEKLVVGGGFAAGANAAVQLAAEVSKGELEAKKEQNAAMQEAEVEGINSAAAVKTMMLEMKTLMVETDEALLQLAQAAGQLNGLYGEKADLENLIAETREAIANRYFADPVHHLRSLNSTLMANLSFDEAQKWLYFMARALEYKWNTPFANYSYLGKLWSTASLYKLRNADELERFYQAMVSFNALVQLPQDDYFDWFSVREDFLGYKMYDESGTNLMYYADPANPSGPANLTAIPAFRSYLKTKTNAVGNIVLNFSTRREIPGGTFYRGPRFSSDLQTVLSAGLFLDKIKWLKISLPGSHTLGRSQLAGELTYGGTSFIRNFDVGTFDLPDHPDRLQDEETAYSTRYWYFHAPSAKWRFSEALKSPVTMAITNNSEAPPSVAQIDIFKERSVATTGWALSIPTKDLGVTVLKIHELDDVKLYFYHYAVSRQMPEGAAAMAEGRQAPQREIPFPYYLKYHTNPDPAGD